MRDMQREILNQVASGQISASEGATRLDALAAELPPPAPAAVQAPVLPPPALAAAGARAIKVISLLGSANVIGDPSVATAVAEGPHRARQDGDTLVIEHSSLDDESNTFTFGGGRKVVLSGPDFQRRTMSIRVNPDLPLFVSAQAGNVNVLGVRAAITGEVQAGNCRLDGFEGPLSINVQAGNVTASGRLQSGASKIRCEMGSAKVNLEKGSSVRISARATMGKVSVDGAPTTSMSSAGASRVVTVGSGAATLDIECTMGSVKVNAE